MTSMDLRGFKQFIIESLHLDGMTPEMIKDDQPLFGAGLDSIRSMPWSSWWRWSGGSA